MQSPDPMRSVTELLRDGFAGDLTSLGYLQVLARLSNDQAADLLMVSPETYRRWRSDRQPNPTAVRLLSILAGYVPWPAWFGWEMHNGLLFPPGYERHGIAPGDFYAYPYWKQLVTEYQRRELQVAGASEGAGIPKRRRRAG